MVTCAEPSAASSEIGSLVGRIFTSLAENPSSHDSVLTELIYLLQGPHAAHVQSLFLGSQHLHTLFTIIHLHATGASANNDAVNRTLGLATSCAQLALSSLTFIDIVSNYHMYLVQTLNSDFKETQMLALSQIEKSFLALSMDRALVTTTLSDLLPGLLSLLAAVSPFVCERAILFLMKANLVSQAIALHTSQLQELLSRSTTIKIRIYDMLFRNLFVADELVYASMKDTTIVQQIMTDIVETTVWDSLTQLNVIALLKELCTPFALDRYIDLHVTLFAKYLLVSTKSSELMGLYHLTQSAVVSLFAIMYSCARTDSQLIELENATHLTTALQSHFQLLSTSSSVDNDETGMCLSSLSAFSLLNTPACLSFLLDHDLTSLLDGFSAAVSTSLSQSASISQRLYALHAISRFFTIRSKSITVTTPIIDSDPSVPFYPDSVGSATKRVYDQITLHNPQAQHCLIDILLTHAQHPEESVRFAAYQCIHAFARPLHHSWSLSVPGYCLNQAKVFKFLTNRDNEQVYQGKTHKYDIIKALISQQGIVENAQSCGDFALWSNSLIQYLREGVIYTSIVPLVAYENM